MSFGNNVRKNNNFFIKINIHLFILSIQDSFGPAQDDEQGKNQLPNNINQLQENQNENTDKEVSKIISEIIYLKIKTNLNIFVYINNSKTIKYFILNNFKINDNNDLKNNITLLSKKYQKIYQK